MEDLVIKKCNKCNALVKVIKDCNCDDCQIMCCNEKMQIVTPNSEDAAFEKHIPNYEIENGVLKVQVNHVMEDDHYIEWICLKTDSKEDFIYFKPNQEAKCEFNSIKNGVLYSYCNKHGLWKKEIS